MIKSYKLRRGIANTVIYIILAVLGLIWISPLVYLILHSFSLDIIEGTNKVWGGMPYTVIPKEFTFDNYINLFQETPSIHFGQWYLNTFIIACFSCVISTISVLMVAYAFSRLRFKSRKKFINIGMILGMFPGFMTMIAIYYLLKAMQILDLKQIFGIPGFDGPILALIICYSSGAGLGYQISKGFFDTIPRALDEAATIDGATRNQIFWKIILPMSKPIVVYTVLTAFIGPWTDFILARIIAGTKYSNYTVAIGLQMMLDQYHINKWFKRFLAGSVLVAVPVTALFLKMQSYYVSGVTAGGVKG